ncbi:DinB family protein [Alkalihalobacillus sp. FSL W8-0930]
MTNFIINQLEFTRRQTLKYVNDINDSMAEKIPTGLRNNIKWNLGHIYVIHEKFAFGLTNHQTHLPSNFNQLFDPGTKPSDWTQKGPSMSELLELLSEQFIRIESILTNHIKEDINPHYHSSSSGLTFKTVDDVLTFSIYHEAMHFATIKNILSILNHDDEQN